MTLALMFFHLHFFRPSSSSCSTLLRVVLHRLEAKLKAVHGAQVFARRNFRISLSPRESIINCATPRNLTPAVAVAASTCYLGCVWHSENASEPHNHKAIVSAGDLWPR